MWMRKVIVVVAGLAVVVAGWAIVLWWSWDLWVWYW
jgi:hypothetical protein